MKLPFVVEPKNKPSVVRLGDEQIGVIELPRYGYLTVTEKASFQKVVTNKTSSDMLRALVEKIHKKSKLSKEKVLDIFSRISSGGLTAEDEAILSGHEDGIMDLMVTMQQEVEHTNVVKATILLMTRYNADWTFEDTVQLCPEHILAIAELFEAEDRRSLESMPSEYGVKSAEKPSKEGAQPVGKSQGSN